MFRRSLVLCDRRELHVAPAAPIQLDVKFGPTNVRLVRPALLLEEPLDIRHKLETVDWLCAPVIRFVQRGAAVTQRFRFERLLCCQRWRMEQQPTLVACPAANDRLQEEEPGHERS